MTSLSRIIRAGNPMDIPNDIETLHIDYEVTEAPTFWRDLNARLRQYRHDELVKVRDRAAEAILLYRTLLATRQTV